ncbi:hypothetical protein [Kibdelosporangium phytohabitans]|uniref:Uncharacterized protein n=1 Tax=Kibdelosporangium phytohabitans TaxID=860235 RepID=A0A0N9HYZ4_9PSEU|nr:hypothetical protein [Kibdelosporangium phytohabitans]ALG12542.1 hypothetical protein AOZ06_41865 [Kibdelosporangium phytohabitans]MBE1464155.1 hypothetical protein [Kibdelosporangium phytohabitans]
MLASADNGYTLRLRPDDVALYELDTIAEDGPAMTYAGLMGAGSEAAAARPPHAAATRTR